MGRLIILAAVVVVLVGCGAGGKQSGLVVHVDTNPFRVTLVANGKSVVTEDKDARLRYQLSSNGEQHKLTKVLSSHNGVYTVATDEPGRTATVTVTRRSSGAHIAVRLHPEAGVQQIYDAFPTSQDDHFLGGGEHVDFVGVNGRILPMKVSNACSYAPVPYFASSAGWGLRLATTNVSALAFPGSAGGSGDCTFASAPKCSFPPLSDRAEVCVEGAQLDEDIYVGDFAQTLAAYQHDAGQPTLPPPDELALIKWRDAYDNSAQVLEDIGQFRRAGVPLGWVLVDNPWETCVGRLTFDTTRFADPAGLIKQVHALGVHFMLWVSPKTQCDVGYSRSQLLGDPAAQDEIDLSQPGVVSIFEGRLRKLVALGVDGFKADRGDEVEIAGTNASLQNRYPLLYARAVMSAFPGGGAAIFRAGFMGSQSIEPGIWAGDQEQTWGGFAQAIRSGESAAMSGFPTWGSDIGGYNDTGALSGDLFARWAQFGAISPVMEVGGQGANATPWTMGPDAMTALREAAVLHYELFPYLYDLLTRGEPVLRPLGFAYPDDPQAWQADLELLVGPDLLAAPVTGPGTTPSVYLPSGSWIDLHTGATVKGPTTFTRSTPIDELPLYARMGAVIPFNLRTSASWWGVDELSHAGRVGFLVTAGSTLDLRAEPRNVQLWIPASQRPSNVTIGGKKVRWTWNSAPLPGVVVRVHGPTVQGALVLDP